jgi:S-adenosyl-L-methionine hydrolase (adenosine-forming)
MEAVLNFLTLTTDFGLKDGNVGVMKGVIWGIAPRCRIADISHQISPQNVREAALILARSSVYFPPDTVHVAVVDPGVGTERRPIAARLGRQNYIAPDNGVLTLLLEKAEKKGEIVELIHLNNPRFWLPEVSHVFHGRDIFAPTGAHLAAGVPLVAMGTTINNPVRIDFPQPIPRKNGFHGEIIHIDHFGNLSTNIGIEDMGWVEHIQIELGGVKIPGLYHTFGELSPGELMALYGSTGSLIISEVNGSAAARLNAKIGDQVEIEYLTQSPKS